MNHSYDNFGDPVGEKMCPCPTNDNYNNYNNTELSWFSASYHEQQQQQQQQQQHRELELPSEVSNDDDDDESSNITTWEVVYTCIVLNAMFALLLTDKYGADSIMMITLAAFLCSKIISVKEAVAGFSNQGVLTVMLLFVVAEGISKTGALDWYLGKVLGKPKTIASAQLRLMVPIVAVSTFINNTPIVVVMIPIVQRWARNCRLPIEKLLIPLSFATILGGTCSLIGTSTNLVVYGLLQSHYPDDPSAHIDLFDLGKYGVPNAFAGLAYILFFSPFLLAKRTNHNNNNNNHDDPLNDDDENILLGARITHWSPAAGRTLKRSGLRDTGGIYLVSVKRAITGNIHRAVSGDFVLAVGDILYFTGFVEEFGDFCEEHGLELMTNENDDLSTESGVIAAYRPQQGLSASSASNLPTIEEGNDEDEFYIPQAVGVTKESLIQADEAARLRVIHRITDMIRGMEPTNYTAVATLVGSSDPAQIVVTADGCDVVLVCIDARDRIGLLMDISKALLSLNLQLHHSEAAVIAQRSLSIWRCESKQNNQMPPDIGEIWSVLHSALYNGSSVEIAKQRGLHVVRAQIVKGSSLIGTIPMNVNFRESYKAAIVAIKSVKNRGVESHTTTTSSASSTTTTTTPLEEGDVLILQVSDDSPLLERPPHDFYKYLREGSNGNNNQSNVENSISYLTLIVEMGPQQLQQQQQQQQTTDDGNVEDVSPRICNPSDLEVSVVYNSERENVWRDLQVMFKDDTDYEARNSVREFLTAMVVAPNSGLAGKTVNQAAIDKLSNLTLVGIERKSPTPVEPSTTPSHIRGRGRVNQTIGEGEEENGADKVITENQGLIAVDPGEPLMEGDILWYSGPASAVGDLRRIPGLVLYENDEVTKIKEKAHDRRLVQAVIARQGPLVGKTVREVRFRTRYGAAVIAVHRDGKRVHEHPGTVVLKAGDVLLLEAGPSFIAQNSDHDKAFALLAEVKDSAPPRMESFVPTLVLVVGMVAVYVAGVTELIVSALVCSILMVLCGILSEQEVRDAVNWEIYITISAAFGIGTALLNSGVAGGIANCLVYVGKAVFAGQSGVLAGVYFSTCVLTNILSNAATAALVFPVAMEAAKASDIDKVLMCFAVMLGASASFMSPCAYTTNLLIYGPGRYKYLDFICFGGPMQVYLWILAVAFLGGIGPWYVSWIVAFALFGIAILVSVLDIFGKFRSLTRKQPVDDDSSSSVAN